MSKSLRQFTCRDDLWARVEALAERRSISADDVVQAALVQLFTRKKGPSTGKPTTAPSPQVAAPPQVSNSTPHVRAATHPSGTSGTPPPMPAVSRPAQQTQAAARPQNHTEPNLGTSPGTQPLYLFFEGQVYEVDQDQFVIGRGSKYSDLAIKDANISRRHCAIVRRNGQYFIKDLESTNGVEFNGQRVDNHLIQEGTSYRLCDHEIRFSFVPPS